MSDTQVKQRIQFWAATDVGKKRDHNEDNFLVDKSLNLFVVADGMGGHAAGEVASSISVKSMRDVILQNKDLIQAFSEGSQIASNRDVLSLLEHSIQNACAEIHEISEHDSDKRGMGTTLSSLLIINNRGFIAHVGDSRIYLLRGGRVVQLTEDHSLVNELIKRGKLSVEEAENSPYKNAVTRAVGIYESVEVDTFDFDVLPGDLFLLATDGLTGYLENNEISKIVNNANTIKDIPQAFIDLANDRGGKDNITSIVVSMVDPEGTGTELNKEINLKIETIRKMPIFKFLTYKELVRIMNITKITKIDPKIKIITEGSEGEYLFIILSGTVKVHKGDTEIVTLGAGDHFGEMALIDKAPRSADVSSISPVRLLQIARTDFFNIIRNEPRLATKILWSFLQVISGRLRTTSSELSGAKTATVEDLSDELFDLELIPDVD